MAGETTYEHIDGPVRVTLVRKVRWSGGRIPTPDAQFYLRVGTTPPVEHPIDCTNARFAADEKGKLVAWRCSDAEDRRWSLLRLRGGGEAVVECRATIGTGDAPDFGGVEPLGRAIPRILGCLPYEAGPPEQVWTTLARSLEEDEGPDSAAELFLATASRAHPTMDGRDAWATALGASSRAVAQRVRARLCPLLAQADLPMQVFARAMETCMPVEPAAVEAALVQLPRLLVRPLPPSSADPSAPARADAGILDTEGRAAPGDPLRASHVRALLWAARVALVGAPKRAGQAVCDVLPSVPEVLEYAPGYTKPRNVAATVLAGSGVRCDAARAWLDPPPCGEGAVKDGRLLPREDVSKVVDAWARGDARTDGGAPRDISELPDLVLTRLGIAYTFGALSPEIVIRNARLGYAFDDAGADAPSCDGPELDAGAACACTESLSSWSCATPAAMTEVTLGACRVHVDDARRLFTHTRRAER